MELKKNFYFPMLIFFICFSALFFILGFYSWPMPGDDFGAAVGVSQDGFWAMQVNMYTHWSGRIMNTFVWGIFSLFPMENVYNALSFIVIFTYAICAWCLVNSLFNSSSTKNKIFVTAMITAGTLACIFFLHETLYMINASPYFWCASLILLATALAVKALNNSRAAFWGCIAVIIINGTVYEQPCIFQGVLSFFAMIYFAYVKDKKRALICGAFWLAAIISFCIMYFAPGTLVRLGVYAKEKGSFFHRLFNALIVSGLHGFFTAIQFFVKPLNYVFLLFLPLITKKLPAAKIKFKPWLIVIITALVAPSMQFLHGWTMSTGLSERGISLTIWCMGFVWFLLWTFFYRGKLTSSESFINFARKYRYPLLIFALLISANFIDVVKSLKLGPAYLAENKARVQSINEQKAAGVADAVVTRLENRPPLLFEDLTLTADTGVGTYYGVKSVVAVPKELINDPEAVAKIQNGDLTPWTQINTSDPQVLYWLGLFSDPIYKNPHGLEMTLEAAEHWDRLGAAQGHARCMRALSRVLYTKDKSFTGILKALYWYTRSQLAYMRL